MIYEIGDTVIIKYVEYDNFCKCVLLEDFGDEYRLGDFEELNEHGEWVTNTLYESVGHLNITVDKTQLPMIADNLTKGFKRKETLMVLRRPNTVKYFMK